VYDLTPPIADVEVLLKEINRDPTAILLGVIGGLPGVRIHYDHRSPYPVDYRD
jgi:hypothetical protein